MRIDQIRALYEYNCWATARIIEASSRLTPEDYIKDLGSSYPSVRDTLVHVMSAEWIWLMRCKGISQKAMLSASDFPTISLLKSRWEGIAREQSKFMAAITEEALETRIAYVNFQGESFTYALWQILQHNVNHSSYHRGQIITLLRQLGAEPVATDFLLFYDLKT